MGAASWAACCISVFGCDLAARANALDGVLWLDELSDCICLSTSSSVSILIPSVAVRIMPGGTWSRLGSRIRKIADGLVFCKLMPSQRDQDCVRTIQEAAKSVHSHPYPLWAT